MPDPIQPLGAFEVLGVLCSGLPLLVILHMGYSAIFAKYVMPIFMIHATELRCH